MKGLMAKLRNQLNPLWQEFVLPYYRQLQLREQRLVLGTLIGLPVLIFVFGLWLPLRDDAAAIRLALPALQAELAEAQLLAGKVASSGVQTAVKGDLLTQVDAAARGSNIRQFIIRIKPQPGLSGQSVLVQLRKSPYADTVRFFSRMAENGVSTQRAKLSEAGTAGLVDVDVTFASK